MNSDLFHAGCFTSPFRLMGEIEFGDREKSFIWRRHVTGIHILLQLLTQKIWNGNFTFTFLWLWSGNDVLSVKILIGFVDINLFCNKVDLSSSQCRKFTFTHSSSVEHLKADIGQSLVLNVFTESDIFIVSPVIHFICLGLPDTSHLSAWIGIQIVETFCVVNHAGKLIVDVFQINIGISFWGIRQLILPFSHTESLD